MPGTPTDMIDAEILQLMNLYDEVFINKAYHVILGREPDDSGRANYLPKVRSGVHRGQIILELAESTEGRSKRNDIAAISAFFGKFRDPDPGPLKTAFRRLFGRSEASQARHHRATENQLHSLQEAISVLVRQQAQLLQSNKEITARVGRASFNTDSKFDEGEGMGEMVSRVPPRISRTVQELRAAIARKRNKQ